MSANTTTIRTLFDTGHNIDRPIEKVISYAASQDVRLKAEIDEYVVTDSIENQLEELLTKMQLAMDRGGANEVGVWVSGFYGSGKSSLTKYLGLALDQRCVVDGVPFLKRLQDRLKRPQTKALLSTVSQRFPAAVVFLDLASEMVAGATMEEVSTVLYYKVLQWAGYSKNLKIAALERKLKKDELYEKFCAKVLEDTGVSWGEMQNDPLVVDSLVPDLAHHFYPTLFKSSMSFTTTMEDYIRFETDRVSEMIAIAREHSGKSYVLFVCDEVGQYVGARHNLILNLDGLAKNLKTIGDGKVWIFGTAQQTLTEDDPRAALNSAQLFKLKDRFPIQIDLPSHDIREICIKRLLGKSPVGAKVLGELFDKYGQRLRQDTSLQDAKFYEAGLDRDNFINLYPFLPAHFDILLQLLSELAKSTGGIGLRSAIKIIQDILIDREEGHRPLADAAVGVLVTTVTLYDALEQDIERSNGSIHNAVKKAFIRFSANPLHLAVCKTIALLQILKNMPVTRHNVASLLQASVDGSSERDAINKAIEDLIKDPHVPLGEQDGGLRFFSEKLNDIEKERAELPVRSIETRKIFYEALKDAFDPLPSATLNDSLTLKAGIKTQQGAQQISLAGEREEIQFVVEIVEPADIDKGRERIKDESRQRTQQDRLFLLGLSETDFDDKLSDIYRCREICQRHRNDPDQEIKEYCAAQNDRAEKLVTTLRHAIKKRLNKGSFLFRGNATAVDTLSTDTNEAASKFLSQAAPQIFSKYSEAPVRVETELPEKFLRAPSLVSITSKLDPLSLVKTTGGKQHIDTNHKAVVSLRDYLDRSGTVEGKKLTDVFGSSPYGWSPDTVRYLVAAMLRGGEIRLKVGGRDITAPGDQAFSALKNNASFKNVGVALRDTKPSMDVCALASDRLTQLIGESVLPLEEDICKHALKAFPEIQYQLSPTLSKLRELRLPGEDRLDSALNQIKELLLADASDAPERLGKEESTLFDNITWAKTVLKELGHGLDRTIRDLRHLIDGIQTLPSSGIPGELRRKVADDISNTTLILEADNFHAKAPELNTALTAIEKEVIDAANRLAEEQKTAIRQAEADLKNIPVWAELTQAEQSSTLADLEALQVNATSDLDGVRQLINQQFDMSNRLSDIKKQVQLTGERIRLEREAKKHLKAISVCDPPPRSIRIPARIESVDDLERLIKQLSNLRDQFSTDASSISINLELE